MKRTLSQQISQFRSRPSASVCDRILSRGIIKLIQIQPLYGILLAKLDRVASPRLKSPIGLTWLRNRISLLYNFKAFANDVHTATELIFWLEHEALHLIYFHPVRYPKGNGITQLATDLTVNQTIRFQIPYELTVNGVNRKWALSLPSDANSRLYVNQLTAFFRRHQRGRDKQLTNQRIKKLIHRSDDHHFWGSDPRLSRQAKASQLKQLISCSYHSTPAKTRGLLPGKVHSQLKRMTLPSVVNWKAYLQMGLGGVAFGQQASRARFNRRQAYRMDLMGTISNDVQPVSIFVDNSGSMGDSEISYLLTQIGNFLKQFPIDVDVYDFDSRVHESHHYRVNNFKQLKFVRIGGGGTRFQSIFDYCQRNLQNQRNRLIIILTDGYGEAHLNYYGFNNLLWILTRPTDDFSVNNRRGYVISLFNSPELRNLEKR